MSVPCLGNRMLGSVKDYEIVFSAPVHKLDSIIRGLESVSRARSGEHKCKMSIRLGIETPVLNRYEKLRDIMEHQL